MIKVKVFAPLWCSRAKLDEKGWMELPDDATLSDVLKGIHMPKLMAKTMQASINSEKMPLDTPLKDGDVVGFFTIIAGG